MPSPRSAAFIIDTNAALRDGLPVPHSLPAVHTSEECLAVRNVDIGVSEERIKSRFHTSDHQLRHLPNVRFRSPMLPGLAGWIFRKDTHARHQQTGRAARYFTHFHWMTRNSWTRARRVIAKAEYMAQGPNARFIVTNLPYDYATSENLYERTYCARGDMENRIKEQQLDLFADRTSTSTMRANQLRLWLSTFV